MKIFNDIVKTQDAIDYITLALKYMEDRTVVKHYLNKALEELSSMPSEPPILKEDQTNVYVVEVGQYSDKTLVATTSTEERAEEIVEAMKKFYNETEHWFREDHFNIHKFELDALPVYVDQVIFEVVYHTHGDSWQADRVTSDYLEDMTLNKVITWNAMDDPKRPAYRILLKVDDEKTALKAGTERILQFIAKEKR